jgi:tRNA pseudouridine55 synthase
MDGLLILDKPQGITSHDCVYRARRATKIKQIGHAGTLDPMATGVLVLCIGKATRLSEYLLGEDKVYEGIIKLGERTNTDDAEGEVIETRPVPEITEDMLARVQQAFTGEILQVPPQFSAIKRDGQRAYALARKGESVELEARRMTIYEMSLELGAGSGEQGAQNSLHTSPANLRVRVKCSAGTYIRSLARDMGEMLGCGGHLTMLRRTQAGAFSLSDALPLEHIDQWAARLLPMDRAVSHFPEVVLTEAQAKDFGMGRFLDTKLLDATHFESASHLTPQAGVCRVYDAQHELIGIGKIESEMLKPVKVFVAQ